MTFTCASWKQCTTVRVADKGKQIHDEIASKASGFTLCMHTPLLGWSMLMSGHECQVDNRWLFCTSWSCLQSSNELQFWVHCAVVSCTAARVQLQKILLTPQGAMLPDHVLAGINLYMHLCWRRLSRLAKCCWFQSRESYMCAHPLLHVLNQKTCCRLWVFKAHDLGCWQLECSTQRDLAWNAHAAHSMSLPQLSEAWNAWLNCSHGDWGAFSLERCNWLWRTRPACTRDVKVACTKGKWLHDHQLQGRGCCRTTLCWAML